MYIADDVYIVCLGVGNCSPGYAYSNRTTGHNSDDIGDCDIRIQGICFQIICPVLN